MKRKILIIVTLTLTVLCLVSCKKCNKCGKGTNEDTPLLLSSQELDGVFNPFFSSSAPDSNIVAMTQIGMLGNDSKGKVTYGDEEGVVVLDLETIYDEDEDITTYYLVLKNNVKFSNGTPLTIKDVLFNLYVYSSLYFGPLSPKITISAFGACVSPK